MTNKNVSLYSLGAVNCFYSLNGIKEQKTLSQYSCVHSIKILDPLYFKFNGKQKVGLTISVTLHISPSY